MKKNSISQSLYIKLFCSVLFILFGLSAEAQYIEENPINKATADRMLEIGNYQEAVRIYSALLSKEPENLEFQFNLGKAFNYSNEITLLSKNDFVPSKRVDIFLTSDSQERSPKLNTTIKPTKIE